MGFLNNPIANMYGPDFLTFYPIWAFAVTLIVVFCTRSICRSKSPVPLLTGKINPYEIACLREGKAGLLRVATLSLLHQGYLQRSNDCSTTIEQNPKYANQLLAMGALEQKIWQHFATPLPLGSAKDCIEDTYLACTQALSQNGLIASRFDLFIMRSIGSCGFLAVIGMGVYKLIVALYKGLFNVFYLIMMIALFAFLYLKFVMTKPANRQTIHKTASGKDYLKRLQRSFENQRHKVNRQEPILDNQTFMLMISLFGLAALPMSSFAAFHTLYTPPHKASGGADGSSFGGSGSGDGGGGCGGGCGGCGS